MPLPKAAVDEMPKTLGKDYLYTNSDILVTLLGGHDDGRFMSEKGATIAGSSSRTLSINDARRAAALLWRRDRA